MPWHKKVNKALKIIFIIGAQILLFNNYSLADEIPIQSYSVNTYGQIEIVVNSDTEHYYLLNVKTHIDSAFNFITSFTLGNADSTIISEALPSYPIEHYQVVEYPLSNPEDIDNDGIDDVTEYQNIPYHSPNNNAESIDIENGTVCIDNYNTFELLSKQSDEVLWSEFLNDKEYVKFIIVDFYTEPKIYFINMDNHELHEDFANEIGVENIGEHIQKGQISYHPNHISNNGTFGVYAFNYSNGHSRPFHIVERTQELLASNMPMLKNNIAHYITANNESLYQEEIDLYESSRLSVLFDSDLYADVDYWGLNEAEGYGYFRHMSLEEIPGPKDIVLYDALPNNLPRVGGIMTSVVQTPLSHVNLRAIQNNIPNTFIQNPLERDSIANLIGHYVYYKVGQSTFEIREASLNEVNAWYDSSRPKQNQIPPLNLLYDTYLPLADIDFNMFDGFGAKCANIAEMQKFDFVENTIPNGFGLPFYYYQEFMKYNDFFSVVLNMISDPNFQSDRTVRAEMLNAFRDDIKNADMPYWMMTDLEQLQNAFPVGTSIRCRSSSNNEDFAGFNGAGLYDSKTQHPHEGHIAKSIKQVYASLWNLRAYEERDFYRINQFKTSMGVLCHPNYSNEKVNGVAVTKDPFYDTENSFYINAQLGEDLITNPNANSIPEELLIDNNSHSINPPTIVQRSNLIVADSLLLNESYLGQMHYFLNTIHNEFELLYEAENNATFAMDIEFKITSDDLLIIKQARPWISFIPNNENQNPIENYVELNIFPNPANEYIILECACKIETINIYTLNGQSIYKSELINHNGSLIKIPINSFVAGIYVVKTEDEFGGIYSSELFMKTNSK